MRTEQRLDPHLRREIRELYVAARDAAGPLGELRCRAGEWLFLPEVSGPGGPGADIHGMISAASRRRAAA